jgi:hypothetical protein
VGNASLYLWTLRKPMTLETSIVQGTKVSVMVKLFRLIEMCLKKPCSELHAGLHLSDVFAVYSLQQEVFFLFDRTLYKGSSAN